MDDNESDRYRLPLTDEQKKLTDISHSDIKKALEKMGWKINPETGALIHPGIYYHQE